MTAPNIGRAFGLDVLGMTDLPGLADASGPVLRSVALRVTDRSKARPGYDVAGARLVSEALDGAGRSVFRMYEHQAQGYYLDAEGFGRFQVDLDGRVAVIDPGNAPEKNWKKFVHSQVLPLAALLQGLEPLHASAVSTDAGIVGFVGASRVGKTSVAVRAVLRGAKLVCDDVLAVDAAGPVLRGWPAPAVVGLRHAEHARLNSLQRATLGTSIGADEDEVRYVVSAPASSARIAALFFLEPDGTVVETVLTDDVTDPVTLLASTFSFAVQRPDRLERQLDVCARLMNEARLVRVRYPPHVKSDELAQRLLAEFR